MNDREYITTQGLLQSLVLTIRKGDWVGFLERLDDTEALAALIAGEQYLQTVEKMEEIRAYTAALKDCKAAILRIDDGERRNTIVLAKRLDS